MQHGVIGAMMKEWKGYNGCTEKESIWPGQGGWGGGDQEGFIEVISLRLRFEKWVLGWGSRNPSRQNANVSKGSEARIFGGQWYLQVVRGFFLAMTGDRTRAPPAMEAWSPNHWTVREFPLQLALMREGEREREKQKWGKGGRLGPNHTAFYMRDQEFGF